ncbi:MAG: hypothetical protein JSW47_22145, partial [Phycisphaerales bacterium]
MRLWRIVIIGVVISIVGLVLVWIQPDPKVKITDLFEVTLDSAKYDTSTSVIHSSQGRRERVNKHLRINCEVGVSDSNLVLGISRRGVVTQLTNGNNEIVEGLDQKLSGSRSMSQSYQGLRYRRKFVPPKRPPRWKTAIWRALRLPPPKMPRPQRLDELAPSRMMLELDAGLPGPDSEKISRIEGYFHVLMAELLESIEIPFKPSEEWVRLTDDLEIRVLEARTTESRYNYRIETRRGKRAFRHPLSPGSDLPSRFPVNRQLLGRDGKPVRSHRPSFLMPASVGGSGSGGGSSLGLIKKIRFVIAVNPSHHKIPFVLEDIPLPGSDAAAAASERARAARDREEAARKARVRAARARRARARAAPTSPVSGTVLRQTWTYLRWEPLAGADSYDVYLGESFEDVNDGVGAVFQGRQTNTYHIAGLSPPGLHKKPYPDY